MGAIDIFHWCLHVVVFVQLVTCGLRYMHKEEGAKVFTLASIKEKHCVFIHQQKVKTKKCNSFVLQGIAISHLAFCCLLISIPCFFFASH